MRTSSCARRSSSPSPPDDRHMQALVDFLPEARKHVCGGCGNARGVSAAGRDAAPAATPPSK